MNQIVSLRPHTPEPHAFPVAGGRLTVDHYEAPGPTVLLLHGFPDTRATWRTLGTALAADGYRVVAPNLRGYPPSTVPVRGNVDLWTLADDLLHLADRWSPRRPVYVVGHDWGAAIAYVAARRRPDRFAGVTLVALPPLPRFLRALAGSPRQRRASRYMAYFQLPGAVSRIEADGGRLLAELWRRWARPGWHPPISVFGEVVASLGDRAALAAATGYYRALLGRSIPRHRWLRILAAASRPLSVPTLVVAGREDGCILPECFTGLGASFTGPWELAWLPTGHFPHLEAPDAFHELVRNELRHRFQEVRR